MPDEAQSPKPHDSRRDLEGCRGRRIARHRDRLKRAKPGQASDSIHNSRPNQASDDSHASTPTEAAALSANGDWPAVIREKLRLLPNKPGVYLFKNGQGKVLYVGKAKRLPARVRSYFAAGRPQAERTMQLLEQVRDFDYLVTQSETEALILEASLVKSYSPRYNVMLKDDKSFPFLKIDIKDPFSRLVLTRRIVPDGSRYFGPYTHVKELRKLLRTLRKVFPLRTCSDRQMRQKKRPCLDYYLGLCPGPCAGLITPEQYRVTVDNLIDFLEGRGQHLLDEWRARMEEHARGLRFEESAKLRDDIAGLEQLMETQRMADAMRPDLDVVGLVVRGGRAMVTVLSHREGAVIASRRVEITRAEQAEPPDMMEAILADHYRQQTRVPPLLLVSVLPRNPDLVMQWLSESAGRKVRVRKPLRGRHAALLRAAEENAHLTLEERELIERGRDARMASEVYALQEAQRLPAAPERIEGYDVSNLQGGNAVGSKVLFVNGRPRKSEYRRFKIRSVEGADDFAMLGEILGRRLRRLSEGEVAPDLILVDGGVGQVNRAASVLRGEGYAAIPLIGLAKREEEIHLPEPAGVAPEAANIEDSARRPVVHLPRSSPALQLLQRVRDEAHRFAIGYHRHLRGKRGARSPLERVPGLGRRRAAELLARFGGLDGLARASEEEIRQVPGIGPALSVRILAVLREAGLHE